MANKRHSRMTLCLFAILCLCCMSLISCTTTRQESQDAARAANAQPRERLMGHATDPKERVQRDTPIYNTATTEQPPSLPMAASSSESGASEEKASPSPELTQVPDSRQQADFEDLLKKKLNKKKNFYVPPLSEEERKTIGPYAEQYDFLRSLEENDALLQKFIPVVEFGSMLMGDAKNQENYGKVLAESRRVRQMQTDLADFYRKAVHDRKAFPQPHKLKLAYDKAFNEKILAPVAELLKIAPYIEEELRRLSGASLAYANDPNNSEKTALLREFLQRYGEVSKNGNDIIREIRNEE